MMRPLVSACNFSVSRRRPIVGPKFVELTNRKQITRFTYAKRPATERRQPKNLPLVSVLNAENPVIANHINNHDAWLLHSPSFQETTSQQFA
jgi:hypothetical protein